MLGLGIDPSGLELDGAALARRLRQCQVPRAAGREASPILHLARTSSGAATSDRNAVASPRWAMSWSGSPPG